MGRSLETPSRMEKLMLFDGWKLRNTQP